MLLTVTDRRLPRQVGALATLRHAAETAKQIAAAILFGPLNVFENRRLRSQLAQMSDHELADIGLARQDVADSVALPLSSDLGIFLASRARERTRRG